MFRIIKNGQVTNVGPDQEWLDKHIEMGSFGSPASQNEDESWNPAEYSVEEFDPELEQDNINAKARAYLSSTDWLVIRSIESGIPVPQGVIQQRQEARLAVK